MIHTSTWTYSKRDHIKHRVNVGLVASSNEMKCKVGNLPVKNENCKAMYSSVETVSISKISNEAPNIQESNTEINHGKFTGTDSTSNIKTL